jgi:hypothetical protein
MCLDYIVNFIKRCLGEEEDIELKEIRKLELYREIKEEKKYSMFNNYDRDYDENYLV